MVKVKLKKTATLFVLASVFTMASCQKDELLNQQATPSTSNGVLVNEARGANFIADEYIVVFKDNPKGTPEIIEELVKKGSLRREHIKGTYDGKIKGFHGHLMKVDLDKLNREPGVAYAEPDQLIALGKPTSGGGGGGTTSPTPTPTPTTPTYAGITVLAGETIPQGVAMVGYGDGKGRTAWVIDSGVDANHPDLLVDAARSVSFIPGNAATADGYGHGTAVAGVIGAKNNGSGIIGVASGATIVSLRVLDDMGGGSLSNLIKAVNHVVSNGQPNDAVNISISSGASSTLDTAIKNCAAKGIFVSIAAGNSYVDCSNNSPQRVNATNVYTVSGMDYNKTFWNKSNFGAPVDRTAPAVNVQTTTKGSTYGFANGTSFAAPHVTGLLLMKGNAMSYDGTVIGDPDRYPDKVSKM